MEDQKIQQLEKEIERLNKVNKALMNRVERNTCDNSSPFSLFEGNILLANQVEARTQELKHLTDVLDKEKAKVVRILESLPGAIVIFDEDHTIINSYSNRMDRNLMKSILNEEEHQFCNHFKKQLLKKLDSTEEVRRISSFNYLKTINKDEYFLDCSITKITDTKMMLFLTDVTEKYLQEKIIREQESHLVNAAKLSSLGEMAGGVAHEINTPLGTIMMLASRLTSLSKKDMLDTEKALEISERIKKTVTRISKIVHSLRQLSRNSDNDDFEETNLKEIVEDALELCLQKFKINSVHFETENLDDINVLGRRVQLSQVVLNLLNNSLHAAQNTEQPWIKLKFETHDNKARIYIIDSGKGINPEIVKNMFNPFFTTKKIGEGTGLGMSISKRIMEDHKGKIEYTEIDGHTAFYLELKIFELEEQIPA